MSSATIFTSAHIAILLLSLHVLEKIVLSELILQLLLLLLIFLWHSLSLEQSTPVSEIKG